MALVCVSEVSSGTWQTASFILVMFAHIAMRAEQNVCVKQRSIVFTSTTNTQRAGSWTSRTSRASWRVHSGMAGGEVLKTDCRCFDISFL